MKYFLFSIFMGLLVACSNDKFTPQKTVNAYYEARNNLDYKALQPLVADSITIIAGDYVMPYNHKGFYEVFKWDSIFKPSYKLVSLKETEDQLIASVKISSIKHEFLKNDGMICDYLISFNSGKISEIKELDCNNVNWDDWAKEVNNLVNWVEIYYPELNGFINNMSMEGAENYVKAIELYKKKN